MKRVIMYGVSVALGLLLAGQLVAAEASAAKVFLEVKASKAKVVETDKAGGTTARVTLNIKVKNTSNKDVVISKAAFKYELRKKGDDAPHMFFKDADEGAADAQNLGPGKTAKRKVTLEAHTIEVEAGKPYTIKIECEGATKTLEVEFKK